MDPAALEALGRLLSPKQGRSIVESQARVNIWEGAIRSGKTVASLIRWLMFIATAPTSGELVMIGKTSATLARNIFAVVQNPDIFGVLARHVSYTQGAPTATILGRRIHVIGANDARSEAKIRGMTVVGAYVDELTLLPNKEFFDQLLARMSVEGAQLFASTNPDSPAHWALRDVIRSGNPDVRSWHFRLEDNPFLPPSVVEAYRRMYVGLFYRRFVLGEWVAGEGAIFEMFDHDRHVVDIVPQIERWLGVGIDYGTQNPFAALMGGIGVDGRIYITGEWRYDGRRSRHQLSAPEYVERLQGWMEGLAHPGTKLRGIRPPMVIVDPSASPFIVQLYRSGIRPENADNEVLPGIQTVSALMARDKLRVHRSCEGLLQELPGYSWDENAAKLGQDKPVKLDDHSVDALRYLLHTSRNHWRSLVRLEAAA